jgi:hypothetical protein
MEEKKPMPFANHLITLLAALDEIISKRYRELKIQQNCYSTE